MSTPYTTYAIVQRDLGQHSAQLLSDLDESAVEEIITEQSKIIDDMIRDVATVPFEAESVPNIIKEICTVMVKYRIWTRKAATDIPDYLRDEYKQAFNLIDKIQKGKIPLEAEGDHSDEEDDLPEGGVSDDFRWISDARYFGRTIPDSES